MIILTFLNKIDAIAYKKTNNVSVQNKFSFHGSTVAASEFGPIFDETKYFYMDEFKFFFLCFSIKFNKLL